MITSSPSARPSTPSPNASTVPAPSPPGTWGKFLGAGSPMDIHKSSRLRADPTSSTLTSPGPGAGVSTSANV